VTTPTPTTTSIEALQASNRPDLMFKALGGIIFAAKMDVPVPAAFTTGTAASLIQLDPTKWDRLGLISKSDALNFPRDISTEDEESWGYNDPTRTDITGDTTSAEFQLQQTSRAALEMYDFVDLSSVTPDADTGEVSYNKPLTSALTYRRMIYLAYDGAGSDRRYKIKVMPRAQVVGVDAEAWSQSAVTKYPMTIKATPDPVLGYSVRNVLAGPGQKSRNAAAGFGAGA
jgi:hypothetical protein